MSDVTPEQARAALEWQAEEAAAARGIDAKVAALNEPAPAPVTPEQAAQQQQAAQLAAVVETQLPKFCVVAWSIVDRLVQQAAGKEFALTDDEKKQLAEATVPVVTKYVPDSLSWLTTTPEGALVMTVGLVYGFKVLAPAEAAPSAAPSPTPTTTETTRA